MISRMKDNILHKVAKHLLTISPDSSPSWFIQIQKICIKYRLPHPLTILESPPSKEAFKHLSRTSVHQFWEEELRKDAAQLDSLAYFKPQHMSLSSPHLIISSCGNNSYEINKAIIQMKMLSGRYRTDKLLSHFHPSNSPMCQLACQDPESPGDLQHLLIHCSALSHRRSVLFDYWDSVVSTNHTCSSVVSQMRNAPYVIFMQFVLDCTAIPLVNQCDSESVDTLLKITRSYCYSIHRERLKILDRWNI